MYEDPKSKISQLEKVLDSMEDKATSKAKRHELHEKRSDVREDWNDSGFQVGNEITPAAPPTEQKVKSSVSNFSMKILFGSIIFFVIALLVVAYNFLGGGNLVSGDNIDITVKAPISVTGGEIMSFEIEVKNNNSTALAGADLGVIFPLGAKEAEDTSVQAKRTQIFLGNILPGQSMKRNLSVALFGEENEKKELTITLEYRVAGSNSLFTKNKTFSVLISSSPVNIIVTGPKEINTNQSVEFNIEVTSNSPTVIKDLLLKAEYPFGFTFKSSSPVTSSNKNVWLIGDLAAGEKRNIKVSGVLNGQEGEERGFNFNLGSQSKADSASIDVPFTTSYSAVTIRRPFVSADIFLNGSDSAEYISTAGSKIEAEINWRNNLSYEVSDVSIIVSLSGNSVDKSSILATGGFYQSIDNTIIFNKSTNKDLATLQPGQSGTSKFAFNSFSSNSVTGGGLTNPTISLSIVVSGQRVDYTSDQQGVLFSDSRKIKIAGEPQLFAKALYYVGPFKNTGPIPAKAEQETTYTITWTVTNPLNNLSNAKVSAILPPYIKWLNVKSPNQEQMDYDSGTGLLTWNVGNVSAGAGSVSSAREVSFQISFLPSVSQIGASPNLVGDATLTAKDAFTLTTVTDSFAAINTRLSNDPYFNTDQEKVVR